MSQQRSNSIRLSMVGKLFTVIWLAVAAFFLFNCFRFLAFAILIAQGHTVMALTEPATFEGMFVDGIIFCIIGVLIVRWRIRRERKTKDTQAEKSAI